MTEFMINNDKLKSKPSNTTPMEGHSVQAVPETTALPAIHPNPSAGSVGVGVHDLKGLNSSKPRAEHRVELSIVTTTSLTLRIDVPDEVGSNGATTTVTTEHPHSVIVVKADPLTAWRARNNQLTEHDSMVRKYYATKQREKENADNVASAAASSGSPGQNATKGK